MLKSSHSPNWKLTQCDFFEHSAAQKKFLIESNRCNKFKTDGGNKISESCHTAFKKLG